MRKLLLILLSIILLAFSVYAVVYGVEVGGFEIKSVMAIKAENDKLDTKIQKAQKLKSSDYPQSVTLLESAYKKLMSEKENYEQVLALGVDENGLPLSKIQEYEMEKIWVTMGNYAKKEGVDLKIDLTSNNSISKTYDLNFTVTGGYIQIEEFLSDIEQDSTLVFRIENFKLVPGADTDTLVGSFTCKDIKINISEISSPVTGNPDEANPEGTQNPNSTTTDGNATNTTNTTSEGNTTNTTSTNTNTNSNTTN